MCKDASILIVEDEKHINRLIEMVLVSDGYYKIRKAFDGEEALNMIEQSIPDLILLDIMLPKIDGLALCTKIKNNQLTKNISVIMLTAKKMEKDVLDGFDCGAIDYITKPFSNKILLARIQAHLKNKPLNSLYGNKNFSLDKNNLFFIMDGKKVKLTVFEFKILELLLFNKGRVYTRSELLLYLRGNDGYDVSERAVDVQIVNLRKKLGTYGKNIETVRGVGYKLKDLKNE